MTDTAIASITPAPAPLAIDDAAQEPFDPTSPVAVPEPIFVTASLEPFNTLGGARPTGTIPGGPMLASNGGGRLDTTPRLDSPILESIDAGFPAVRDKPNGVQTASLNPLNPIPDITANSGGLSFSVPHDAFIHTDNSAVVKLEARQVGGGPLPGWLSFDGISGLLNGSVRSGEAMPNLQLEIIARDNARREARTTFTVLGNTPSPDLASTEAGFPAVRLSFDQLGVAAAQRGTDMLVRFRPVPDQQVDSGRLTFSIPADAFAHTNPRATIRLEARLASGEPLPSWVNFNNVTGRLTGTTPDGFEGVLRIHVTARDQQGLQASTEFTIDVRNLSATVKPQQQQSGTEAEAAPQRQDQGAIDGDEQQAAVGDKPRDEPAKQARGKRGAAGFSDQLRAVREVRTGAIDASLLDRALQTKVVKRPAQGAPKS